MGRGKNKQKQQQPQTIHIEELEIENKVEIDYDKLAEAIVRANQIQKVKEKEEEEKAFVEWRRSLGYKEHADKTGFTKKVFSICNRWKMVLNLMFFPKKKKMLTSPTGIFLQECIAGFFRLVKTMLTLSAAVFTILLFYHPDIDFGILEVVTIIVFALLSFLLSRLFRLMAIEIEQMSNREQLLGVFSAIITVFSLFDKVIELLLEVV